MNKKKNKIRKQETVTSNMNPETLTIIINGKEAKVDGNYFWYPVTERKSFVQRITEFFTNLF